MKKAFRYLLIFISGLGSGILVAQGLIVAYARDGGNLGSEPLTVLIVPVLLITGCVIGSDLRDQRDSQQAFKSGYQKGISEVHTRFNPHITPEQFVRIHEKDILKQLGH